MQRAFDWAPSEQEADILERNVAAMESDLREALSFCGISSSSTAYKLALLIFHITKNTRGALEWTGERIGRDAAIKKKGKAVALRTVQRATKRLHDAGIIKARTETEKGRGAVYSSRELAWVRIRELAQPTTPTTTPTTAMTTAMTTTMTTTPTTAMTFPAPVYGSYVLVPPPPKKAAAEILESSEMAPDVAANLVASHEIDAADAQYAVDTYNANRDVLNGPGAITWFFRNGKWPNDDVKSLEAIQQAREAKRRRQLNEDRESRRTAFYRAYRSRYGTIPSEEEIDAFLENSNGDTEFLGVR